MRSFALCVILPVLACCNSNASTSQSTTKPTTKAATMSQPTTPRYEGPELTAALAQDTIDVTINAPSGGYELKLDRVTHEGDLARVELTLIAPGEGEMNTMAFETKRASAKVTKPGKSVLVLVSRERRGEHYLVKPAYELAKTLAR